MGKLPDSPANDGIAAVRRAGRQAPRPRFYQRAGTRAVGEGYVVELDAKPVRTPARHRLAAPTRELADAIAAEWQAQREIINPAKMPLTRLANAIIDGVVNSVEPVRAEIAKYLASDLLFYRAGGPPELRARQARQWDPVLAWARDTLGASFVLGEGVIHVSQPAAALAAASSAIPDDAWRLGALHAATTLTESALLALALAHGRLSAEEAWQAAHVDEHYQEEKWGRDAAALEQRALRFAEFQAAASILKT